LFCNLLPKLIYQIGSSDSSEPEENYEELYSKLIASTARSAALANRLAEIHR
jgi:hypothetical protein